MFCKSRFFCSSIFILLLICVCWLWLSKRSAIRELSYLRPHSGRFLSDSIEVRFSGYSELEALGTAELPIDSARKALLFVGNNEPFVRELQKLITDGNDDWHASAERIGKGPDLEWGVSFYTEPGLTQQYHCDFTVKKNSIVNPGTTEFCYVIK